MIMEQKTDIAIVIPTSRPLVLHRALASLSSQTDKGFKVYVLSWKKDERTGEIVSDFEDSLDIRYFSFDDATPSSLSALQKKGLTLLGDEDFVMFLSDDNELTPKCIRRFRKVAKRDCNKNVYHYNINVIDMANKLISKGKRFPRVIKVDKLFKKVFYKDYPAPLSSFIFRRSVLQERFVTLEEANRSDLATIFACAKEEGIRTIPFSRVLWRRHSAALASNPATAKSVALDKVEFLRWSEDFFQNDDEYPVSPSDRIRLYARSCAALYPDYTKEEIKEKYMQFKVFTSAIRKMKGSSALRSALGDKTGELKGNE